MASLPRWCVLVALALAATGGRAHAESPEAQVERLAAEAVNAYRGADYNRAIELLTRAYEIRQVPALLYNLAKAYDKLGEPDQAYDAYRRYANSADADPRLRAKSEARLLLLEEARRKKAAAERPVEPARTTTPPPATSQPVTPPTAAQLEPVTPTPATDDELRERARADRQRARRRDRYVALGLGVGAVALAGVAVGFSVSALQQQSQWSAGYGVVPEATRRDEKNTAITRAAVADGLYAAAVAAAGVGAFFVYRGFHAEPKTLALVPVAAPTGGALALVGRF